MEACEWANPGLGEDPVFPGLPIYQPVLSAPPLQLPAASLVWKAQALAAESLPEHIDRQSWA